MSRSFAVSMLAALWLGLVGLAWGEEASYEAAERAYRTDNLEEARRVLETLVAQEPEDYDAKLLLGFVRYRQGDSREAERLLRELIPHLGGSPDLFYALALTSRSLGRMADAARYAERARRLAPGREDIARLSEGLTASAGALPPYRRPDSLHMPFVVGDGYFRHAGGEPILVRGVNLGLALPGRFPAEFPEERAIYDGWLELIGAMNANAVRLYTIVPPVFYQALRDYNLAHPEAPLYLLQGVWTEPPEDHDYRGAFLDGFVEEAERALDALHGNADLVPRPGHAAGRYGADVSPWLLGMILGREWEPYSVRTFDALPGAPRTYRGEYFELAAGTPMEAWLAEVMDRVAAYALARYHLQTPLAFTNWPTLDPLHHPTESNVQEELALREAQGEPSELEPIFVYNYDEVSVDARRIRTRPSWQAGHFASYHAYPYHPDFLLLDPVYNRHPRSSYMAYLEDLKAHHGDQAVLVAEFGVPSSRGVARYHPRGYHHGAHSEADQGRIDRLLFEEISDSGMAGGVVFAWLDEWFKRNWLYYELERPAEHIPRWHSVMNPEQNYGLVAFDGVGEWPLRGAAPWQGEAAIAEAGGSALYAQASPRYLQLAITGLPEAEPVTLELDLHPASGPTFLVTLGREEGRLLVNAGYRLFTDREESTPWAFVELNTEARPEPGAPWVSWITQTQRRRFARDGTVFPRRLDEPGRLRPGEDPEDGRDPLADYRFTAEGVQLRLPWTLLGVTDPSAGYLFDGPSPDHTRPLAEVGVRVVAGETALEAQVRWPRWTQPATTMRLKPAYYVLKDLWAETWSAD